MLIKAGVDISRLRPEIRKRLNEINAIYTQRDNDLVITSTYEGTHSAGSLHYANLAIDVRFPNKYLGTVTNQLIETLGQDFDVIEESDHIHIEYDPK